MRFFHAHLGTRPPTFLATPQWLVDGLGSRGAVPFLGFSPMNNAFVFEREPLRQLSPKLSKRLRGACLSIMRYMILEANHTTGWWDGKELQRGQIFTGRLRLVEETGLSEQQVRSAIELLEKSSELTSNPTSVGTFYTIVNYDSYDGMCDKVTIQVTNNSPATNQRLTSGSYNSVPVEQEEVKKNKEITNERGLPLSRSKPIYQPSEEAQKALQTWDKLSPLPTTCDRTSCLKTLDDLVRLDHLTWDRVYRICEHACKEWAPKGFISSPVKLRKRTRNGELMTWESIERQLNGQPQKETFEEMEARLLKEGIIGPWSAQKP